MHQTWCQPAVRPHRPRISQERGEALAALTRKAEHLVARAAKRSTVLGDLAAALAALAEAEARAPPPAAAAAAGLEGVLKTAAERLETVGVG